MHLSAKQKLLKIKQARRWRSFIGYAPAMFCFSLYGYILDLNPGIIGYKIVFGIMACFAFCGAVVSVMLVKRISQRKKETLAAEA